MDIWIVPAAPGTVHIATNRCGATPQVPEGLGVYRSVHGGEQWAPLNERLAHGMGATVYASSVYGGLWRMGSALPPITPRPSATFTRTATPTATAITAGPPATATATMIPPTATSTPTLVGPTVTATWTAVNPTVTVTAATLTPTLTPVDVPGMGTATTVAGTATATVVPTEGETLYLPLAQREAR